MSLLATIGLSQAVDGREAGLQAMQQALDQAGRAPVAFAWLVVSHLDPVQQVVAGATELLGDIPLIGFSTSAALTASGKSRRSVAVALLCGDEVKGRSNWWPDFVKDSRLCTQNMLASLAPDERQGEALFVVADGINGDADSLCKAVASRKVPLVGCLSGGELWRGRTYQVGGRQSGSGGLAAAVLGGEVSIGVGAAHGWQPVGAIARLTRVQGPWVRTLDDRQANETYARLFGYAPREWAYPPLNDLVRLYPLGLQENGDLVIRSPLRVEADGSLRMNAILPEGKLVDLMIGTQQGCLEAARRAASQALSALGGGVPRLAVLLVDAAWGLMLELKPGGEVKAVREILGDDIPLLGGYTYGQIAHLQPNGPAQLLNQHIVVLLFGSKAK